MELKNSLPHRTQPLNKRREISLFLRKFPPACLQRYGKCESNQKAINTTVYSWLDKALLNHNTCLFFNKLTTESAVSLRKATQAWLYVDDWYTGPKH